jgi:prohibitin 2
MEDNLRLKLEGTKEDGSDGVFARAISLQLRNVDLPKEYNDAVAEKQAAEEDIPLAQNQRIQDITKANTTLLAAKEEARIINNTAVNDVGIIFTRAWKSAAEITYAFEREILVIAHIKENLNLTTNGILAFISKQLFEAVPNLRVTAAEPARLSRRDEL